MGLFGSAAAVATAIRLTATDTPASSKRRCGFIFSLLLVALFGAFSTTWRAANAARMRDDEGMDRLTLRVLLGQANS
jgi:hypothetical protein